MGGGTFQALLGNGSMLVNMSAIGGQETAFLSLETMAEMSQLGSMHQMEGPVVLTRSLQSGITKESSNICGFGEST